MDKLLNVNLNPSFQTYMSKEEDERKIRNTELDKQEKRDLIGEMLKLLKVC